MATKDSNISDIIRQTLEEKDPNTIVYTGKTKKRSPYLMYFIICFVILIILCAIVFHSDGNSNTPASQKVTISELAHTASDSSVSNAQTSETINNPFVASFKSNINGLSVSFTDTSTGTPTKWHWDFGNGQMSNEQNPEYTYPSYPSSGSYKVILNVEDSNGNVKSASDFIDLKNPIQASFTTSITGLSVKFADTSTGTPTKWYWSFGDGDKSNEQNPIHTYSSSGTYTVSLGVKDDNHNTNLVTKELTLQK
jgi:PKD repeat protein